MEKRFFVQKAIFFGVEILFGSNLALACDNSSYKGDGNPHFTEMHVEGANHAPNAASFRQSQSPFNSQTTVSISILPNNPGRAREPVPAPQLYPPPPPFRPTASEVKGIELRELYTKFKAITEFSALSDISYQDAEEFVTGTIRILIRFPEYNAFAKQKWNNETRLVYKILFGSIVYIANPSNSEAKNWLRREARITQQEFADMDEARLLNRSDKVAFACTMSLSRVACYLTSSPLNSVVNRFLNSI